MAHSSLSQLVCHVWTPHYRSVDGTASFDPYLCLGLPHEALGDLVALLKAFAGGDSESVNRIAQRSCDVRDAHRAIAASLHPDFANRSLRSALRSGEAYRWIPLAVRRGALETAHKRLADCVTAALALADENGGSVSAQSAETKRFLCMLARDELLPLIAQPRASARAGTGSGGALVVLLALFGDLAAAGVPTDSQEASRLALYAGGGWLSGSGADADSCPARRGALGLGAAAPVSEVTAPLQACVEDVCAGDEAADAHLVVRGPLCQTGGVWDPCPGYPKSTLVVYAWRGWLHVATVQDGEGLRCPMRKHRVHALPAGGLRGVPVALGSRSPNIGRAASPGPKHLPPSSVARPPSMRTVRTAMRQRAAGAAAATERAAEVQRAFAAALQEAAVDARAPAAAAAAHSAPSAYAGWAAVAVGVGAAAAFLVARSRR